MKAPAIKGSRLPLVVAALVFAGANVAFFLTYRSGFAERRAALEARRDALQKSVESAEKEATRVAGQKERLGNVSAAIDEFYGHRIGSERETLAPLVAEIHAILDEVGVAAPQISYGTAPVEKLPLTAMRITFSVRCDYPRFKRLLREFETSPKWLAVRDVGIVRDSERPGSVQVQLGLVTYFSEAGGPADKPQNRPRENAAREKPAKAARRRENAAAEAGGARSAGRASEEDSRRENAAAEVGGARSAGRASEEDSRRENAAAEAGGARGAGRASEQAQPVRRSG